MYNEKVMNEFRAPANVGEVENANAVGQVGNAACGDIMKITMRIENGIIEEVRFQTYGCAAAVATSSIATKMIKGKTVDEALALTNREVVEELGGLPAQKIHCSVLAEGAIKAAIKNYLENYKKEGAVAEPSAR